MQTAYNNTAANTALLPTGYHNGVPVKSVWVGRTASNEPYAGIMFTVNGQNVPFYGMLTKTETKDGKTPFYYTMMTLSRIGYTKETKATFEKDAVGRLADIKVEHYTKNGEVRARVCNVFAVKANEETFADLDDSDFTEEETEA